MSAGSATLARPANGAVRGSRCAGPTAQGLHHGRRSRSAPHNAYGDYFSTRDVKPGSASALKLPDKPGTYELRYVAGVEEAVLRRRAIEVR